MRNGSSRSWTKTGGGEHNVQKCLHHRRLLIYPVTLRESRFFFKKKQDRLMSLLDLTWPAQIRGMRRRRGTHTTTERGWERKRSKSEENVNLEFPPSIRPWGQIGVRCSLLLWLSPQGNCPRISLPWLMNCVKTRSRLSIVICVDPSSSSMASLTSLKEG